MEKFARLVQRSSFLPKIIFVLLWIDALYKILYGGLYSPLINPNVDFPKHWDAAQALVNGTTPYFETPPLGYNYPLFISFPYLWLGWLSLETATTCWIILNFIFIVTGMYIIARYLRPSPIEEIAGENPALASSRNWIHRHWTSIVVFIVANYKPFTSSWVPANVEAFHFLFFSLFSVAILRNKNVLAAISWAMFTLIKLVPVILVIPMFFTRRYKQTAIYLGILAGYATFIFVSGYWRTEAILYQEYLPKLAHFYDSINLSGHKMLALIFKPSIMETAEAYNRLVFAGNTVLGLTLIGICALWYKRGTGSPELIIGFAMLWLPLMSPLLEYMHFCWGLPLLFFQLRAWCDGRISHFQGLMLLLPWMLLITIFNVNNTISSIGFHWLFLTAPAGLYLAIVSAWVAITAKGRNKVEERPLFPIFPL